MEVSFNGQVSIYNKKDMACSGVMVAVAWGGKMEREY